ncbi:MAG TPA: hypothetical protein VLA52_03645 [Thermohalobaculum sp.]|nr:hypothetical protein [Thermohalobaculum sp.]
MEDAYSVFRCDPPQRWSGDNTGYDRENWQRLSAVQLRELTRFDTDHFLSETGAVERSELRYILPRMFDLIAQGEAPHVAGEECSLSYLAETGYPEKWTEPERSAVERFFAALLDHCLSERYFEDSPFLDVVLCMAGNANADLGALLDRADRAGDKWLARAVAHDIDWIGGPDAAGGMRNAFWESAADAHASAAEAWYRRPELLARMERAFFAETDPDWQQRLSDAIEAMRGWSR